MCMVKIKNIIEPYLSKRLEVKVNDEKTNLLIIDWTAIEKDHEKVIAKTKNMTEQEKDSFWSHTTTDLMAISEYFIIESDYEEKIEDKEWLPFGLLGLDHNPDSFAEMNNDGLLVFDLTEGDKIDPPVILLTDGECETLAPNFSKLKIKLLK